MTRTRSKDANRQRAVKLSHSKNRIESDNGDQSDDKEKRINRVRWLVLQMAQKGPKNYSPKPVHEMADRVSVSDDKS